MTKIDTGERCEAMNTLGDQCEDHVGHEGKHWTRWRKIYWKINWKLTKVGNTWRAKKVRIS